MLYVSQSRLDFNTSYVVIKHSTKEKAIKVLDNFNTSYVVIKLIYS